ncbi:MAG: hypothetical protein OHK006_10950 [Thermodesulfovibrionales bacterium]
MGGSRRLILSVLLSALCGLIASGCITPGKPAEEQDLLRTTEIYNKLMASHQFDKAISFVASPYRAEFDARSRKAQDLKILDHRLVNAIYLKEKGEAHLVVEFEYYYVSSPRKQFYTDTQKWLYVVEEGSGAWRLASPFPAFP